MLDKENYELKIEELKNENEDLKNQIKEYEIKTFNLSNSLKTLRKMKNNMLDELEKVYDELNLVGFFHGAGSKERGRNMLREVIDKYK